MPSQCEVEDAIATLAPRKVARPTTKNVSFMMVNTYNEKTVAVEPNVKDNRPKLCSLCEQLGSSSKDGDSQQRNLCGLPYKRGVPIRL